MSENVEAIQRYTWSRLNRQQVGRFSEYFVKMEFALYGFEIFTSEVDDRGIDFIVRHGAGWFYEVQVKSVRGKNYVFMEKTKFPLVPTRLLGMVLLNEGQPPDLYLIPATEWKRKDVAPLLVSRDYSGLQSKPDWGVQVSKKSLPLLAPYRFSSAVQPYLL